MTPDDEDFLWPSHQHSAKITPHGTLIMFDNGTNRARPGEPKLKAEESWSRAVEFEIDEEKREIRQVWSYGGPKDELFFSPFISGVDWLPVKENILITDGGRMRSKEGRASGSVFGGHYFARILEVTHESSAEKVFEVVIDDPAMGWAVYRSERIPSLYPSHARQAEVRQPGSFQPGKDPLGLRRPGPIDALSSLSGFVRKSLVFNTTRCLHKKMVR